MYKRLLNRLYILGAVSILCTANMSAMAVSVTEIEESVQTEEDDPYAETPAFTDENPYYTDDEFNAMYEAEKAVVLSGNESEAQTALSDLYHLALYRGMTSTQLQRVLNEGFLVDNIDDLKKAGILDEDFTLDLAEGTPTYSYDTEKNVTQVDYADVEWPDTDPVKNHNFPEINTEAELALLNSTSDLYADNTYIQVRDSGKNKTINGMVFNAATLNGTTGIYIDFTDDDYKVVKYRWYPTGWMVASTSEYNLGIEYDETHIHFNAQQALPRQAGIFVKMEEPEMKYNLFYSDGSLMGSYTSDENGYIYFTVKDATDYKVSTGNLPFESLKGRLEDVKENFSHIDFNEPSVLIVCALEIILFICAIVLVIIGIRRIKQK